MPQRQAYSHGGASTCALANSYSAKIITLYYGKIFDNEFKTIEVELLQASKSVRQLCDEYDLQVGTIRCWRKEYDQMNDGLSKKLAISK